jgi:hypothetical protein
LCLVTKRAGSGQPKPHKALPGHRGWHSTCQYPGVGDAAEHIRVQFIRNSVAQVSRQALTSRDEARVAAGELRRYFGWVRGRLPLPVQEPLRTEIESLCSFLDAPPEM